MIRTTILLVIISSFAFSQGKKYEFAKSYLENGQFEDAARLFGELYSENPDNENITEGLLSSYYALNRFSDMLEPLKIYSEKKNDPSLYALLGDIYWKTSKEDLARQTWEKTLKKYNDRVDAYQLIASAQNQNRLFQDAIDTYNLARKNFSDQNLFTEELIKSYVSIGDFKNGIELVIVSLDNNRSISAAQGRIYALMASDGAIEYIRSFLEKLADKNSKNLSYQELLAWFYNTTNNFEDAFEVYKRLDDLHGHRGRTIYKFAEEARKDENHQPAIKAYEFLIDNDKKYSKYFRGSLLGYAKSLEAGLKDQDSIDSEKLYEIIDRYEEIISDDEKSNLAEEAYFRIARIYKEQFMDFYKAINNYQAIIDNFNTTEKSAISSIEIGDIHLLQRNLDKAVNNYQFVIDKFPKALEDPRNLASYKLGLTKYYQGKSDEALKFLTPLGSVQNQNIANDALQLIYMIGENKDKPAAVDSLGVADFLAYSSFSPKDTLDAENAYRNIHKNFPATPAAEKSFQKLADLFFENDPKKTIEVIDQFLYLYPTSILVDEILILKAKSFEKLGDSASAQEIYNKLLVEHPNSIYLQQARDSIRRLRGEL
jgi:tetratricopeptide (TPR) repeat protein